MGGLQAFGLKLEPVQTMTDFLPLSSVGLGWVVPALVGTAAGLD
ncbi:branched-chain amino acid transport system II carrier protein [Fictibacillus marinisediminis]